MGQAAIAQVNLALSATATHTAGGIAGYAASNYNDNVIAASSGCTSSAEPWGWTLTNGNITFTWAAPVTFNKIVLYKSNRPMTSCQMQYWNGSAFVTFLSYSGSTCSQDSVTFAPITTTILKFDNVAGSTNPNHREIRILSNVTAPPTVSGSTSYCVGATISLTASSTVTGPVYTWSGPSGFTFTGPTITIPSATVANAGVYSCVVTPAVGAASAATLTTVNVNPVPGAITGSAPVCAGSSVNLSCATAGGSWTSANTAIASVVSAGTTGIVTGVTAGTTTISYTLSGGCTSTAVVTVSASPAAVIITASSNPFCSGGSAQLTGALPVTTAVMQQDFNSGLGAWSITNSSGIASSYWQIRTSPGYGGVTGDGTPMMQAAADATSAMTSTIVTSPVFSLVGYASASLAFNQYYSANASDNTVQLQYSINGGSSWFTLVNILGATTGSSAWSPLVPTSTYTIPPAMIGQANCRLRWNYVSTWGLWWAIDNIVLNGINPSSTSVSWSPVTNLYTDAGLTTPYTGATTSAPVYAAPAAPTVATMHTYSASVTVGSCTNSTGTKTLTVNPLPATLTGPSVVCAGGSITLASTTSGGSWSSSNSNATVSAAGTTCTVNGVSAGTAVISYILPTGCQKTAIITINAQPAVITGLATVCVGASTALSTTSSGGAWSSGNPSIAIVDGAGSVTGMAAGTANISYTNADGCHRQLTVTVNAVPGSITGTLNVCTGMAVTLSSAASGGSWSSSSSNASVSSSGTTCSVTGVTAGTAVISYTLPTGCFKTATVTVNQTPDVIMGPSSVCIGSFITLTNASSGTWASSNASIASVDGSGSVTGMSPGTAGISFATPAGCYRIQVVSVNALPSVISGTTAVCAGSAITLSSGPAGGSWASSNTNATVTPSGTSCSVNGVTAGTAHISYTLSTGCYRVATITVNASPAVIAGPGTVCTGSVIALTDATVGGTWASSNASVASVDGSGNVTGNTAGTATISYTIESGCYRTHAVTVNALPAAISGPSSVCTGNAVTLASATSPGSWSASNSNVSLTPSGTSCSVAGAAAGTSVVSYSLATGCYRTALVSVNATPGVITGASQVCAGSVITLATTGTGGSWASDNLAIASVDALGNVTGFTAGAANISYTSAEGCYRTRAITVNALPAAISGPSAVCTGSAITMASATMGGTWASSNANASVTPSGATCSVSGVSAGSSVISYTLSTGCFVTKDVTVNQSPDAISGPASVCVGSVISLSTSSAGGSWVSSNATVASVDGSGNVSGNSAGTATISYINSAGCFRIQAITVNALPEAISGPASVCTGSSVTFASATSGGTWATSNANVSVTPSGATCLVNGVTAGTSVISYIMGSGCYRTAVISVNTTPAAITGASSVCAGSSVTLSTTSAGGTWSSSNTDIASVDGSGMVIGNAAGVVNISYTSAEGCYRLSAVSVNALPAVITGATTVCTGSAITVGSATAGGSWSASNANVALVPSGASCAVNGAAAGTSVVSYSLPTGCYRTYGITINTTPAPLTGPSSVCVASAITLSTTSTGGSWSSSNGAVASVISGLVSGNAAGTTNISYTSAEGCFSLVAVTVNALPAAISGPSAVCTGSSVTLSSATAGGSWASSNSNASVTPSGASCAVGGVNAGTATISYSLGTGCYRTTPMVINATPAAITGPSSVCAGSGITLASITTGGSWSSDNASVASVDGGGFVSGLTAGSANISYTSAEGCYRVAPVVVNPLPAGISGPSSVCTGFSVALASATLGGSWSSSNENISLSPSGASCSVSGATAGSSVITYTLGTGCYRTASMAVNATPAAITGPSAVCAGFGITLGTASSGGSWSTSSSSVATVDAAGLVTGVAAGSVNISYTSAEGCYRLATVTVNPVPSAISGPSSVCTGSAVVLSSAPSGGTWASSNANAGVIASGATCTVNGLVAGPAVISYVLGTGCYKTAGITVNQTPAAITGPSSVCAGYGISLSTTSTGGSWASSNMPVATVGSGSGVVTGIAEGNATISYISAEGCFRTQALSVNPLPAAITGTTLVCEGSSVTIANATAGGSWGISNANASIAPAAGTCVVSGVHAGSAVVTYTISSGCFVTADVTIAPLPAAIAGVPLVAPGNTTNLSTSPAGGEWTSSNTSIATVNGTSGIVSGVAIGTANITYTTAAGCRASVQVTVSPLDISGPANICISTPTTYTHPLPGGTWSTSSTGIATIDAATGVLAGVTGGTILVSYSPYPGFYVTRSVSVLGVTPAISGVATVCSGFTTLLTSTPASGVWSSSNTGVATVDAASGLVSGVTAGTAVITYAISVCFATRTVTVNQTPAAITGSFSLCVGSATPLSSATAGGSWASSSANATVGTSGMLTGVTAGTALISYSLASGCRVTQPVTLNALPAAITGTQSMCQGSATTLSSATPGMSWSSDNTSIATVATASSTSVIVTGVATGITAISYTSPFGCNRKVVVTVNEAVTPITGEGIICSAGSITLSNISGGGTWSSSNTAKATVGAFTGIVAAVATGTATISYIVGPTCYTTHEVTVNASPDPIAGPTAVCVGSTITLTHPEAGGVWTSSSTSAAVVGAADGVVTGMGAGSATITYQVTEGCFKTMAISVNAAAPAIGGTATVCQGSTTTLTNTASGTWSSTNEAVATVPLTPGIVTGVSAGTAVISFRQTSTGCFATRTVTVNALPTAITGANTICMGSTESYTVSPSGGVWSSSAVGVVGIGATSGDLVGNSVGTSSLSYTLAGCRSTKVISVVALPAVISGSLTICEGANSTLSSTTAGQVWSSSNASVATVASVTATTGLVTGTGGGTAVISYTNAAGCARTVVVSVTPSPSEISGGDEVCIGGSLTMGNTTGGGTWSGGTSVASVNAGGVVTGLSLGTVIVTYRTSATCFITKTVSVISAPEDAITGPASVCIGATVSLAHPVAGGTWSSSAASRATVSPDGTVTGISAGTAIITYYTVESCFRTFSITVSPLPATIGGTAVVCEASSVTLTNSTPGGSWISDDADIATVGSATGTVTGIAGGTVVISYKVVSTGCFTTKVTTVNELPDVITGENPICAGATETWESAPSGGTWASSSAGVASVNTVGLITGAAAGTSNISYTLPTGCRRTRVITVNALPAAITGTLVMCIGGSTTLTSATASQTWSSSDATLADVVTATPTSCTVTGLAPGTATISYANATGCARTVVVTVTSSPAAITGDDIVCIGGSITLSNPIAGGSWTSSSSNATAALSTGIIGGVSVGLATITYRLGATCFTTKVVTVTAQPTTSITGPSTVCVGTSMTLTHPITTGTWVSANTAKATVNASTGVVTGIAAGSVVISYFVSGGCYKTTNITVLAPSMPVSGTASVCATSTTNLSCATSGGTWSTTDASIATVTSSTGVVTGQAAGTAFIVYTLSGSGCNATKMVTVYPLPSAIASSGPICIAATDLYSSTPAGGSWVTSAGIIATVASSGVVTGVAAGTARISYTLPTGCRVVKVATVNALPGNITGTAVVNEMSSVTLGTVSTGGTWSSGNTSIATIGSSSGVVTGVLAGTTSVTYQFTSTGCFKTRIVTVNPFGSRPTPLAAEDGSAIEARIYPSPTTGTLTVEAPVNGTFSVYTLDGRQVAAYEVSSPSMVVALPYNLAAGVYMCRFEGADGSMKLVKIIYTP